MRLSHHLLLSEVKPFIPGNIQVNKSRAPVFIHWNTGARDGSPHETWDSPLQDGAEQESRCSTLTTQEALEGHHCLLAYTDAWQKIEKYSYFYVSVSVEHCMKLLYMWWQMSCFLVTLHDICVFCYSLFHGFLFIWAIFSSFFGLNPVELCLFLCFHFSPSLHLTSFILSFSLWGRPEASGLKAVQHSRDVFPFSAWTWW